MLSSVFIRGDSHHDPVRDFLVRPLPVALRRITLRLKDGPSACTIDCQGGSQPGIYWTTGGVLVRGFTITGSTAIGNCIVHAESGTDP